jgi:aquaporin Z
MHGQPAEAGTAAARPAETWRALLALESPDMLDFDDPSLEWRRLFSEVLGTFLLVLAGAGAVVVGARLGGVSRAAAVTVPGLTVTAIILFMGGVSGAHLNPVVSIAFALRRDFPWRRCFGYIVAQLTGATLACAFLLAVLGNHGQLGATVHGAGVHDWQAMLIEAAITAGLVSTILGTSSTAQNVGALSAVAVGAYIALAGLWSSPVSGASMNPARSFGPDVIRGDFTSFWVYLVGPALGALIAVAFAYVLRGPGGGPGGQRGGAGTLGERVRGSRGS